MSHKRSQAITIGLFLTLLLVPLDPLGLTGLASIAGAEDAKPLFVQASQALNTAQFKEALDAYGKAESASKTSASKASAANGQGYVYMKWRKYAQAIPHLKRAIEIDPTLVVAWNNLGACHLTLYEAGASDKEALDSALSAFGKVAELDPDYQTFAKTAQGYLDQEKAWAEAAAKRADQPPRTVAAEGTYSTYKVAGEAAEQEGDAALAQANFERSEATARGKRAKSAAANFQGLLALRQRKIQVALKHSRRATELNSKNKYAWNNLGAALLKSLNAGAGGKELVEEAIAAYKKVAELDSAYKPGNLTLAESILAELGGPSQPEVKPAASTGSTTSP